MKLLKCVQIILGVTVIALIYIDMQMQIFDLAYQGKTKEKVMRKYIEDNGNVTYSILTMKSANNLGDKMLMENSKMQFGGSNDVVQITMPSQLKKSPKSIVHKSEKAGTLLSLISPRQAEAKPQE